MLYFLNEPNLGGHFFTRNCAYSFEVLNLRRSSKNYKIRQNIVSIIKIPLNLKKTTALHIAKTSPKKNAKVRTTN